MADDQFQVGSGSWWDATTRNRLFDTGTPPTSTPTTLNNLASFESWPTEMAAGMNKPTSITASGGVCGHEQSSGDGGLADQKFQMMGLGLSSQNLDWNQALFTGEKVESSFRPMLQEDFHHKLYCGLSSSEDSSANEFKQVNRPRFSLDKTGPFSCPASSNDDSTITSGQNLAAGFQVDFHDMLLSKNHHHQQKQQQQPTYHDRPSIMNYSNYPSIGDGYGANASEFTTSANKYPQQFLGASLPLPTAAASGSQLHFTNNTPFWNASAPPSTMQDDARSSFFPAGLQTHQIPTPSFNEKTKKNSTEITSNKRPRGSETDSPLPAFKVRKEKMGDRITALQQLVSPFGKTDTASVLSEAIAYIHFLHEQVSVLSNPYLKNGAPIQHHQNSNKSKDSEGLPHQDLRNRGLCLVPVSSTFPITHEATVDFWTPTFGGTFR